MVISLSLCMTLQRRWLAEQLRTNGKNRNRSYFNGRTETADFYRWRHEWNGIYLRYFLVTTEFDNGTTAERLRNTGNVMLETRHKCVFKWRRKVDRDGAEVTSSGKLWCVHSGWLDLLTAVPSGAHRLASSEPMHAYLHNRIRITVTVAVACSRYLFLLSDGQLCRIQEWGCVAAFPAKERWTGSTM